MTRKLPSVNALRAFEASARLQSFKLAAAELNVTPAAVSHQVKALEEQLGVQLFHRLTRALRLTEAGQTALPSLTEGFESLFVAVEHLRAFRNDGLLTISVSPSFGSLWLVPRLDSFRRKHPDIEIRMDGTDRLVDVAKGEVDLALRYGPGGYKGVHTDFLFGQLNTPVCCPALLEGEHPLRHPSDLRHHTLLHVEWKDTNASWGMWLAAAGQHDIEPSRGPRFNHESMAVEAAIDGQGVALIGDKLVADHIASGRLASPFAPEISNPLKFSYYLLSSETRRTQPKVSAFRTWLLSEARKER